MALGLIGGGVVGIAVGGGFLWNASQLDSDGNAEPNDDRARDLHDRADGRRTIGTVAIGVGAAVLVGGIVKFALVPEAKRPTVAGLHPVAGGAMVVFSGVLE